MASSAAKMSAGRDFMNMLQNTTYQPSGPRDGFIPAVSFENIQDTDHRRTDYRDDESIVTTLPQSERDEAIRRDGEAECACTGWFKRMVLSTPGFPSPIVRPPKIVYEVRDVVGRGLGVYATEDIQAGDLITAERPLIVKMAMNSARARSDLSPEDILRATFANLERSMELLCSRMSSETLRKYTSLYNSHKTDGSGPLTGIFRTNGFNVGVNDPAIPGVDAANGVYSCVGALSSRYNHSCLPNASHEFNMPSFSMEIHAVRPVAKGEEITVSYTDLSATAAERQAQLKPYGFTCTCMACKDPGVWDKERARAILDLLPKTSQGVQHAEAALAAFEATGLQTAPRYIELLNRVAQINRKKGRKSRADELESLAQRVSVAQNGRAHKPKAESDVKNYMFGSPDELLKFMMQHGNETERASMMKAFMQIANPDPSQGTQIIGPDGNAMTMYASDFVPRPSGL
ncbi:unnamed protein product [Peniophora sp. CBMAI 1063]|nr:unnamed protein product [Peniophora sp. CBMAI 1063]